uniref:KRAB-A domain-containing protein 2-like n=1 Tax=Callorhinchus milii TaxID=7868 RepID=A0A4W3GZE2_CALMI
MFECLLKVQKMFSRGSCLRDMKNVKSILSPRYEVLQCGDVEKLIKRRTNPEEPPLYYVSIEDTFEVIKRAHIATGHGGRDRMIKELQHKYANVPTKALELFKSLCEDCQKKRKRPMTKGVVARPTLTEEFASGGQVDLIDMRSTSHSNFKWIMVYQDCLTKFCVLRPLFTELAAEVAFQLLDIFLLLGAPAVLQSDNGSECTARIVTELKQVWPNLTLFHGQARHPQSQGSVERTNRDIKEMLGAWLSDNNAQDWTVGIKFVQFQKNSAHHSGISCSPYAAMFGNEARVGLTSSSLPTELISTLESELHLMAVLPDNAPEEVPVDNYSNSSDTATEASMPPSDSDGATHTAKPTSLSAGTSAEQHSPIEVIETPTTSVSVSPDASITDPPQLSPVVSVSSMPEMSRDAPVQTLISQALEDRLTPISKRRDAAQMAQVAQAEGMVKRSRLDLQAATPGCPSASSGQG